ncbi:hypothetical protein TrVFT333_003748 [Trichoderma virens FT-333]|nr:hypothetical protein TrVFT333_003748 [Trichoderma virens FT-333]
MKFAHDYKQSLASQGFPPHWVAHAIPYGQLKKCLKKVQRELQELGLDAETLRALLDPNTDSPVALNYSLNPSSSSKLVRPKLTVNIHLHEGNIIDASLAPTTRHFFEKIASGFAPDSSESKGETKPVDISRAETSDEGTRATPQTVINGNGAGHEKHDIIEVPLVSDGVFFDILQSDLGGLDALQATERDQLKKEVKEIGKQVSQVSRPTRFSKSDLDHWRHIFELYLDAEVFFATHEQEHGARSSQKALQQLQWFQNQVQKQQLVASFKLAESRSAFSKFLELNLTLLKHLQFQELNMLAISKILKSKHMPFPSTSVD